MKSALVGVAAMSVLGAVALIGSLAFGNEYVGASMLGAFLLLIEAEGMAKLAVSVHQQEKGGPKKEDVSAHSE